MSGDAPASKPFEFSADNNKLFRSAGYWMGIVGRLGVLFGVLFAVVYGINFNIPGLVFAAIGIICGVWNIRAAAAFRKVDESAGNDVPNVMVAVENLASLYQLQSILIGIGAAIAIVIEAWVIVNAFMLR